LEYPRCGLLPGNIINLLKKYFLFPKNPLVLPPAYCLPHILRTTTLSFFNIRFSKSPFPHPAERYNRSFYAVHFLPLNFAHSSFLTNHSMKKTFTIALLCAIAFTIHPVYSSPHNQPLPNTNNSKSADDGLSIVSNGSSGDMQVVFKSSKQGKVKIFVINEAGETVIEQTTEISVSSNTITLKGATSLDEGAYTVNLVSGKETYTKNFLLWK
jgi:hypothetical protein